MRDGKQMMEIQITVSESVSYAMYHNGMDPLIEASVLNTGEPAEDVEFTLRSDPPFFAEARVKVASVSDWETLDLKGVPNFAMRLDPAAFSSATEKVLSRVVVEARSGGELLGSAETEAYVLPFDHWQGCGDMPESVAAFVTPNSSSLASVRSAASDVLGEWGQSPSLEGYQGGSDRVMAIGSAVFAALERMNINYVNPPAGFEQTGQRIRLPDDVLAHREGTCIDLAVLYASAMESVRVNPLIFISAGHAFAGFWIEDEHSPDPVFYDASGVTRLVRNNKICAVECTAFTNAAPVSFESARRAALKRLDDAENFVCAVDVRRARFTIKPLPTRRMVDGEWVVDREEAEEATSAPSAAGAVYEDPAPKGPATRVDAWKRDLLDITNRNSLLNMKNGAKAIPLMVADVGGFENLLADGKELTLLPKPQDWDGQAVYGEFPFECERYIGNYAPNAAGDVARGRLCTPLTEGELEKSSRSVYRLATKEVEESGCSSLFVALGVLRWYEGRGAKGAPHYAPLILVPAEMRRMRSGYAVRRRDEDTIFNVTLAEKMRQEYEILIPDMDPLPADDSGVNVDQVLQAVRRAVDGREGWDVLRGAALGVFSYSQYVMWKDLDTNMERFEENPIVRCMLKGEVYPESRELDYDSDPYSLCLTVPADGSQIKAVKAVAAGRSFVMHGPPGTGKSQTITNMICNELYSGRTVLFVAEKKAALEVVQKRLTDVGIGNHCLEIHSNKAEKSKVLEQLASAMEEARAYDERKLDEQIASIGRLRSKLDSYVSALHEERPWGLSAYECISRYEGCGDGGPEVRARPDAIARLTISDITEVEILAGEVHSAYALVAGDDTEFMNRIRTDSMEASLGAEAGAMLAEAEEACADMESKLARIEALGLPFGGSVAELERGYARVLSLDGASVRAAARDDVAALCSAVEKGLDGVGRAAAGWSLSSAEPVSAAMLREAEAMRPAAERLVELSLLDRESAAWQCVELCQRVNSARSRLGEDMSVVASQWNTRVYDLDARYGLKANWDGVGSKGFLAKGKARKEFMAEAAPCLKDSGAKFESLSKTVGVVSEISADVRAMDADAKKVRGLAADSGAEAERLRALARQHREAVALCQEYGIDPEGLAGLYGTVEASAGDKDAYVASVRAWGEAADALTERLQYSGGISGAEEFREFAADLRPNLPRLFDWSTWNSYRRRLEGYGFSGVAAALRAGAGEEEFADSVRRSMYRTMIDICRQESEALKIFNSRSFESSVESFKRLDSGYTNLNRNLLKYRLYRNLPRNTDRSSKGSEAYILNSAINSTRMRKSIRKLLSEIPNILPKVCPCMLMSPLSVAQYITVDYPKFDTVIFDESSQITTCKAIGALGRARNAVIAGDNKQLPPTRFFQKQIEAEDDDDTVDADSFLDDCLSLDMPGTYLEWHYRSRHESLIAFSNRMFYENRMLTFPSPDDREARVSLRFVEGGTYRRGRSDNPAEAEAVVQEISRRLRAGEGSIGVIAFGVKQQACIQDMLDDLSARDKRFDDLRNNMREELFVKNLETVQGDERDVILFSICYGPDSNGTVYQNFGPLNRDGGQRRLNVAVSRSRTEMVVFSSMRSTAVKLTPNSSGGVKALKEFLAFAENGGRFPARVTAAQDEEPSILESISGELEARGYDTARGVGNSKFKVDVAVVDPDDPGRYILGILNDGESYRSSQNTRDREYARADVLKGLGWSIVHVWSVDWHFRRDQVMDGIVRRLEELRAGVEEPPAEPEAPEELPEDEEPGWEEPEPREAEEEPGTAGRRAPYVPYEPETFNADIKWLAQSDRALSAVASPIIRAESPVSEECLIGLVCRSVGAKRLSAETREGLTRMLRRVFGPEVRGSFVTYWAPGSDPGSYGVYRVADDPEDSRSIEDVPLPDILNAIVEVVSDSVTIQEDATPQAVSKALGYSRMGSKIRPILEEALGIAAEDGTVVLYEGRYSLP